MSLCDFVLKFRDELQLTAGGGNYAYQVAEVYAYRCELDEAL